jgi:hypothetical protein
MARKKRRKKRTFKGYPHNYIFWLHTLKFSNDVYVFLEKGNQRQKNEIKHSLVYLKKQDEHLFKKVNGEELLKELK